MAYSRRNLSGEATFTNHDLENPFAYGAFRYVARGTYVDGPSWRTRYAVGRNTCSVVASIMSSFITLIPEIMSHPARVCMEQRIYLNHPGVWTFKPGSRYAGQKTLIEPFINNYRKFNSNTGWVAHNDSWSEVMQSLSHFSYHKSGGQMVLCDLQGGVWSGRQLAVLSDPVILSRNRTYGVTDLGPKGISTFFCAPQCNRFCKGHWQKPRNTAIHFNACSGTTMKMPAAACPRKVTYQPVIYEDEEENNDSDDDYY
eukprot:jgi/Botrbrau1/13049/Bobra.0187s0011.1